MNSRSLVIVVLSLAFLAAGPGSAAGYDQKFVTDSFEAPSQPGKFQTFDVLCPSGYSAIIGTLREIAPGIYIGSSTASGPHGRTWTFEIENSSGAKVNILVQVRCVNDVEFQQKSAQVSAQPGTDAEVKAKCSHGYRAVGRGEHVSMPGPPDQDDFEATFSMFLAYLGVDDVDVALTDILDEFDYYLYLTCIRPADNDDKTSAKKPKLKTKTVKGSTDAKPFNFAQVDLKCPRGYSPTTPSFGPLPDRVRGFIDIPGTKKMQPVRFLNASPDQLHLEASLLCITIR